jgi:hypothetical protein|tara:strand:+ start:13892 stop:15115 length:1224 start_codon:yes stop_codon:yes gene_type:complete
MKNKEEKYFNFVPHGWSSKQPWGEYDVNSDYYDEFNNEDDIWDENAPTSQPYIVNVPPSGVIGGMPMSSFNAGDTSVDSRESVNGKWGKLHSFGRADEEFDNFLTKKSRARRKLRKGGMSKQDALKAIPKDSFKTIAQKTLKRAGSNLKKVGSFIKNQAMFIPRQAARALIALNYRGMAYKLNYVKTQKADRWNAIKDKWVKMGGSVSKLEGVVGIGKNKKYLFCWAKCKAKIGTFTKSSFNGAGGIEVDTNKLLQSYEREREYNNVAGVDDAVYAATITAGGLVVNELVKLVGKIPENKLATKQFEEEQLVNEQTLDLMAKEQNTDKETLRRELDIKEMAAMTAVSPINQIMQNPDLSPAEKEEAVKQVNEALEVKGKRDIKKYAIIGGIALIAIVVLIKAFKNRS